VVASLTSVGDLLMIFPPLRQPFGAILGIPHFDLILGAVISWVSLLGVCLLWGTWPDIHWQRRSGILLILSMVDVVNWTLRHSTELGLYDGTIGHEWFRNSLGSAMAWSEFALMASLAADLAGHLGEPRAVELSRSLRSLSTTGAMVWFLYFSFRTDWRPPIWPLRPRMPNPGTMMLALSWTVVEAICFVQSAILSLLAARCCAMTLVEMAKVDRENDLIPSRSEDGWDEMTRKSGPNDGA
jgi:hypothetical protein